MYQPRRTSIESSGKRRKTGGRRDGETFGGLSGGLWGSKRDWSGRNVGRVAASHRCLGRDH